MSTELIQGYICLDVSVNDASCKLWEYKEYYVFTEEPVPLLDDYVLDKELVMTVFGGVLLLWAVGAGIGLLFNVIRKGR